MLRISRTSPANLIAVLFATALVTFTVFLQAGVRGDLERAVRTATGDADLIVTLTGADSALPADLIGGIRAVPGVEKIEEQTAGIAMVDDEIGAAIGVQSLLDDTLFHLTAGRMPTSDKESVIVETPGKPMRYLPGAEINLKNNGGGSETIVVVGTAEADPGATMEPSLPTLLCSRSAAQRLLGIAGSNAAFVHASGSVDDVRAQVAEKVAQFGTTARVESSSEYVAANASKYEAGTQTVMLALRLLTAVALLAALVVVGNNYRLQLARRTREIALLRSIGALRRQVFTSVIASAAVAGALGAVGGIALGVVAGVLALKGMPAASADAGFWMRLIALGLAAGVFPSVLSSVRPARRATRVAPVEALRLTEPAVRTSGGSRGGGGSRTVLAVLLVFTGIAVTVTGGATQSLALVITGALLACAGLLSPGAQIFTSTALGFGRIAIARGGAHAELASEQLRRHPGRSDATAAAVWLGATLMAALLSGSATAQATLGEIVEAATPTDIIVTPAGDTDNPVELGNCVSQLPQVANTAVVSDVVLDAEFAASPDSDGPMTVAAWTPQLGSVLRTDAIIPEPEPGTIILPPTPETTAGSGLVTVTLRQSGNAHPFDITVIEGAPLIGIVHQSDLARFAVSTPSVWVKGVPGADPLDAADAIGELPGVATLNSPAAQRLEAEAELTRFVALGLAFLAVALVIAVVGLSNTVALSVTERYREIGLLRALGARRTQITGMVLTETLLLALAAGLIGVVFGVLFGVAGANALLGGEKLHVVTAIPWASLAALVVGLLAASAIGAVLPARRAAAIPPTAALAQ